MASPTIKRAKIENGPAEIGSQVHKLLPLSNDKKGADFLEDVSSFVSENRHKNFDLKNGAKLKIGDLNDTIYRGDDDERYGWGRKYLPKLVSMQVIGVVEELSCPFEELILMTCEDKVVYGYDGEDLHLVASSLTLLFDEGITYPSSQKYYRGQANRDMSDEEWAKVEKRLDQEHEELVTVKLDRFLERFYSKLPEKATSHPLSAGSCSAPHYLSPEVKDKGRILNNFGPGANYSQPSIGPCQKTNMLMDRLATPAYRRARGGVYPLAQSRLR